MSITPNASFDSINKCLILQCDTKLWEAILKRWRIRDHGVLGRHWRLYWDLQSFPTHWCFDGLLHRIDILFITRLYWYLTTDTSSQNKESSSPSVEEKTIVIWPLAINKSEVSTLLCKVVIHHPIRIRSTAGRYRQGLLSSGLVEINCIILFHFRCTVTILNHLAHDEVHPRARVAVAGVSALRPHVLRRVSHRGSLRVNRCVSVRRSLLKSLL